jgi:hypothetical protein
VERTAGGARRTGRGALISVVDPRELSFAGITGFALVTLLRTGAATDTVYWQISVPLILSGIGLAFFLAPLMSLAPASARDEQMAAAAALQHDIRRRRHCCGHDRLERLVELPAR